MVEPGSRAEVGFVHQQDFGLDGQGAGDAQALLLAARQAQGALFQPVLDLVPQGRAPQAALDDLVQLGLVAHAVQLGAVGDVVVDAHGEGVGLLKDHAHAAAQGGQHHVGSEDVLAL